MNRTNTQIDILLTSYMGGDYLREQLDSLLSQSFECVHMLIRDDGSSDQTPSILAEYTKRYPDRITLVSGPCGNVGPSKSIQSLLEKSSSSYVALCDQDDVWFRDKLKNTYVKMLELEERFGKETPLLVHTDSKIVDSKLKIISESFWSHQNINPHNRETLNRLLVQNVITGCTVMINKPLRDVALPFHADVIMHDWWLALVASTFGKIGHLDQPTMLYRQHDANTIGAKSWGLPFVLKGASGNKGQVRESIVKAQKQARAFLEMYRDELPEDKLQIVDCYAHLDERPYYEKVYLLLKYRLFKAGLIRNFGFWVRI